MKRKTIQIAIAGVENTASTQCNYITVALCDDGTIWEMANRRNEWQQLPEIPQGELQKPF